MEMNRCILCGEGILERQPTNLVSRGIGALCKASQERVDTEIYDVLKNLSSVRVHTDCRKNYIRPSSISASLALKRKTSCEQSEPELGPKRLVRSNAEPGFDIKSDCLFCGKDITAQTNRKLPLKYRKIVHEVRTIPMQHSIRRQAVLRNDEWGQLILARIAIAGDLVAAEAKYCHARFFTIRRSGGKGREEDKERKDAFEKLCSFLQSNDECQFKVGELVDKMEEYLEGKEGYTAQYLLRKLTDHFGDGITIATLPGRTSLITLSGTSEKILHQFHSTNRQDVEEERRRLVEDAAKIIRRDIRSRVYDTDNYLSAESLSVASLAELVPSSLLTFINIVLQSKGENPLALDLKRISLSHAIISACRPRSFLSPLMNSLGLYVHRQYGSRQLIDLLNNLGLCCSYKEAKRFEYSLIEEEEFYGKDNYFTQFVFDNADFNIRTLDGQGTFHSMGGIKITTPIPLVPQQDIPRKKEVPSSSIIASKGEFAIKWYKKPAKPGLKNLLIEDLVPCSSDDGLVSSSAALDLLWLSSVSIPSGIRRPHWNGFMRSVFEVCEAGEKSCITAVPFINLDPGNLSTIYTSLKFAAEECRKIGQKVCFVTFDQPLYAKAVEIVAASDTGSDLTGVVVRLGGFHLLMSFMVSIGHIMQGSGLEEAWNEIHHTYDFRPRIFSCN